MGTVMFSQVMLSGGFTSIRHQPAVIEMHDDGTFSLFNIDKSTRAPAEIIFDRVPMRDTLVSGASELFILTAGGVKSRLNFAPETAGAVALGIIGIALREAAVADSGLSQWLEAFRRAGARVTYRGVGGQLRRALLISGVALGVFIVAIVVSSVITIIGAQQ